MSNSKNIYETLFKQLAAIFKLVMDGRRDPYFVSRSLQKIVASSEQVTISENVERFILTLFDEYQALKNFNCVAEYQELLEAIDLVVNDMGYRDSQILKLRFGLGDNDQALTLKVIGEIFNISEQRVGQIEQRALSNVRRQRSFANKLSKFMDMRPISEEETTLEVSNS